MFRRGHRKARVGPGLLIVDQTLVFPVESASRT